MISYRDEISRVNTLLTGFHWVGLIKLRICFLKALTDSKFGILLLIFFHWLIVHGKKEFRKYLCLTLNKGMSLWFLVVRVDKTYINKEKIIKFEKQAHFWYHCHGKSSITCSWCLYIHYLRSGSCCIFIIRNNIKFILCVWWQILYNGCSDQGFFSF